jgi:hypothetical protein
LSAATCDGLVCHLDLGIDNDIGARVAPEGAETVTMRDMQREREIAGRQRDRGEEAWTTTTQLKFVWLFNLAAFCAATPDDILSYF